MTSIVYGPSRAAGAGNRLVYLQLGAALSGNATLGDLGATGGMSSGASDLSGGASLGDVSASGGMSSGASVLSGGASLGDVSASGAMAGAATSFVFGTIVRAAGDRARLFSSPYGNYGPLRTVVATKHVAETVPLLFPFGAEMPSGVTLVSLARTCVLQRGTDPAPGALLLGAAIVDFGTGDVVQWVTGGVGACRYLVVCTATLSNAEVLVRAIELPVIDF